MKLKFEIPGPILGWQRTESNGKRRFNSSEQVAYQTMVGYTAKIAMMKAGFKMPQGVVGLTVNVYYERPKSHAKLKRGPLELMPRYKTSKPDMSNIIKNIEDALNKIAWVDDAKVALYGQSGKFYTSIPDGPTYAVVEVWVPEDAGSASD